MHIGIFEQTVTYWYPCHTCDREGVGFIPVGGPCFLCCQHTQIMSYVRPETQSVGVEKVAYSQNPPSDGVTVRRMPDHTVDVCDRRMNMSSLASRTSGCQALLFKCTYVDIFMSGSSGDNTGICVQYMLLNWLECPNIVTLICYCSIQVVLIWKRL